MSWSTGPGIPYSPEGMTFQLCLSETPPSPSMTLSKSLAFEPLWRALSSKSGYSSRFLSALTSVEYSGKSISSTRSLSTGNLPILPVVPPHSPCSCCFNNITLQDKQKQRDEKTRRKNLRFAGVLEKATCWAPRYFLLGTPVVLVGDPGSICWRPRYFLLGTPVVLVGDPGSTCWGPRYASGGVK